MRILTVLPVVFALAFPLLPAGAEEPWTESMAGWSLQPHGDQPGKSHVANLRLDQAGKHFGTASLAFDFLGAPTSVYTELRLTLPQPYDARAFDVLHVSYLLPAGVQPSGFAVILSAPDWSNGMSLREPLKPVAGEWQDLTIPLNAFAAGKPGWDWGKIGSVQVMFYWYSPEVKPGTVHVDGLWLERTGEGIGQMKAPHSILFLDAAVKDLDPKHRQALEQAGWVISGENLGGLTWEKLSKFNVAVLGTHPGVDVNRPTEWEKTGGGKRALLERFVAEGGVSCPEPLPGRMFLGQNLRLIDRQRNQGGGDAQQNIDPQFHLPESL